MKILKIWVQNINSLRSREPMILDLNGPAFADAGLFTITGPTGAGKSSILDALCLALYNRTPRFGTAQPAAHVMSHGTAESLARVEYQIGDRVYQSTWFAHRARKDPRGQIQGPDMTLVQRLPVEETLVSTKPTACVERNIALTGLEFDHFRKAVLLAQGDFAAFLKGSATERMEILERLTDSARYKRLGAYIYARHQEVQGRSLDLENQGIRVREEIAGLEPRDQVVQAVQEGRTGLLALERQGLILVKAGALVDQMVRLGQRRDQALNDLARLESEEGALGPVEARLTAHRRVLPEATVLKSASEARVQRVEQERQGEEFRGRLEDLVHRLEKGRGYLALREREVEDKKAEQPQTEARAQELEALDRNIALLGADIAQLDRTVQEGVRTLEAHHREIQKLGASLEAVGARRIDLDAVRSSLAFDLGLDEAVETGALDQEERRLEDQRAGLRSEQALIQAELEASLTALADARARDQARRRQTRLLQEVQGLADTRAGILRDEAELGQAIDGLESSLEALRKVQGSRETLGHVHALWQTLEPGCTCPVCGATVDSLPPEPSLAPAALDPEGRSPDELAAALDRFKLLRVGKTQQAQGLQDRIEALEAEVHELGRQLPPGSASDKQEPTEEARVLQGVEEVRSSLAMIQSRALALEERIGRIHRLGKLLTESRLLEVEATNLQGILQAREADAEAARERQEQVLRERAGLAERLGAAQSRRTRDFPEAGAQKILEAYHGDLRRLEAMLHQGRMRYAELEQDKKHLEAALEDLRKRRADGEALLDSTAKRIQERLGLDLEEALGALLDAQELAQLQAQVEEVRQRRLQWETGRKQDAEEESRVRLELEELLPGQGNNSLEELKHRINIEGNRLDQAKQEVREALGRHELNLARITQLEERLGSLDREREAQHQELLWSDRLNRIAGSAKGDVLARFVQNLNLGRLLVRANHHLDRLHARYHLVQNPDELLAFDLEDLWQGGQIRTTQNLSGGETFLVSLALALGLADMASAKVEIDTLFIDEGFGSLDGQTLDVALGALEQLAGRGKLVGLISHVEAMKDRIALNIQVRKLPDGSGQFRLAGP